MSTEQGKRCTKCQQIKPFNEFGFDSQRQIYRAHCKVCCSEYAKRYRESGPQGKITKFFASETERQCTQCLQIKPLARFQIRSDRGNRYNAECRDCANDRQKLFFQKHPEIRRQRQQEKLERVRQDEDRRNHYKARNRRYYLSNRLREFSLTKDDYLALVEAQGGVCAICGKPETIKNQRGEIRALAIDHDHRTGRVRGLLCFRCNTDLAVLENEAFVSAARTYVARSGQ